MEKYRAEELLDKNDGNWDKPLKQCFDDYRDLYAPDIHGALTPEHQRNIEFAMYREMFTKNREDVYVPDDPSEFAFIRFAEIHDAYNTLIKNPDYEEFSLDYRDLRAYDTKMQGEKIAKFRYITERISAYCLLPVIAIVILMIGLDSIERTLAEVLCYIFVGIYVIQYVCGILSAPIDMLLVLPSRLWRGLKKGATVFFIFVPITIFLLPVLYLLGGFFALMFYPHVGCNDRVRRCKDSKKYQQFCVEIVNARYKRTIDDLKRYREEDGGEAYKNMVAALKHYSGAREEVLDAAIGYGKPIVMRDHPFYASEKAKHEKKIQSAQRRIKKLEKRLKRQEVLNSITSVFDDGYGNYYFDELHYELMMASDIEQFEKDKGEKEAEIERHNVILALLENRVGVAALTVSYLKQNGALDA